jgi:hypothetical protein
MQFEKLTSEEGTFFCMRSCIIVFTYNIDHYFSTCESVKYNIIGKIKD